MASIHDFLVSSLLAVLILVVPAARAVEPAAPLAVYGQLPAMEDVALSPDGSRIAWLKGGDDRRMLVITPMGAPKAGGLLDLGERKVRSIHWADGNTLLLSESTTELPPWGFYGEKREWSFLETYDVEKHELKPVNFRVPDYETFNNYTDTPMIRVVDGLTTVFVRGIYVLHSSETYGNRIRFSKRALPALFKYTVANRAMHLIALGSDPSSRWIIDEAGRIAAEFSYHASERRWDLQVRKDGRMTTVASDAATLDLPRIIGFSADGDSIYVRFVEGDSIVWKPLSLRDGTWGAPLANGAAFDSVFKDRLSGRVLGGSYGVDDDRYAFFDSTVQSHWNTILQAFHGERLRLISHTDDFKKSVVQVFGATHGYSYELIDWDPVHAQVIGDVYQDLASVAAVRTIAYPASDGLQISAQLTLPRDKTEKSLPLIVMAHDGPAQFDSNGFHWWAQSLAAQGYAVLQPNFRGSDLSRSFLQAGYGEWGRKMQSDLSDGVHYLAEQGVIDPTRVCIVGRGYGGYAALAGVTLQTGIYRCSISVAGIADLKKFLQWANSKAGGGDTLTERQWDRFLGISGRGDSALPGISPSQHVSASTVPVLLIHGRDDTVVPYEQSEFMADALKHAGRPVELVTLDKEDHWLSRSPTRLQMLQATVAFLKVNNPPD